MTGVDPDDDRDKGDVFSDPMLTPVSALKSSLQVESMFVGGERGDCGSDAAGDT